MSTQPRTTFAGKSPFPKTPKKTPEYVDPSGLEIGDDPVPVERASTQKYEAVFSRLTPGQCIKAKGEDVGKIANSLRKWAKEHRVGMMVKTISRYPGDKSGLGRVWLLAAAGQNGGSK